MRCGPGEARNILLSHIISARPSKQPLMVRTFLKVYMGSSNTARPPAETKTNGDSYEFIQIKTPLSLGFYFLFLQEQIKDIIIIRVYGVSCGFETDANISESCASPFQGKLIIGMYICTSYNSVTHF